MIKGIVPDDPQILADTAGLDLDTYTLARIGQSEEGLSSDRAKIAVMYAALNHANNQGKSITDIACAGNPKRSDYAAADGHYGRQGIHPYCSTIAAPKPHTIELAQQVMSGEVEDETEGAQWWDNPHAQDALHLVDPATYKSSAEIAATRSKNARLLNIPGVSTRFWV